MFNRITGIFLNPLPQRSSIALLSGKVTKEEFSESLVLMKAPLNKEETLMVIKFLTEKPFRAKIDYLLFARGVQIPFPIREDVMCEVSGNRIQEF